MQKRQNKNKSSAGTFLSDKIADSQCWWLELIFLLEFLIWIKTSLWDLFTLQSLTFGL
jgi:hypothetical protein